MSTRYNNGSHYENHQRSSELRDLPAHEHRSAIQHGQEEHLTAHELSRMELEAAQEEHIAGNGRLTFNHRDIEELAHRYWIERGSPEGSPDEDWLRAVRDLRARAYGH